MMTERPACLTDLSGIRCGEEIMLCNVIGIYIFDKGAIEIRGDSSGQLRSGSGAQHA
jgi:hypothetical protein